MTFEQIIEKYKNSGMSSHEIIEALSEFAPIFNSIKEKDKHLYEKAIKKVHEKLEGPHFDECYGKAQVEGMYHTKRNGTIYKGEVFTITEAEHIYDKDVRKLGGGNTIWDVYVALNAQYHDYCKLFKDWFGDNDEDKIKEKVSESAISFWFKDEDSTKGKVWKYFEVKE